MWDAEAVHRRLAELRAEGVSRFGSSRHGYALRPPIELKALEAFEAHHGIVLPEAYREFVLTIGDGGAGPYYGLFSLGDRSNIRDADDCLSVPDFLRTPFPHAQKWNVDPPPDPVDGVWTPEQEALEAAFDEWYQAPDHITGSLAIAEFGCGDLLRLIVTGPERGMVSQDGRCSSYGLWSAGVDFKTWYEQWLKYPGNPDGTPQHPVSPEELQFVFACMAGDLPALGPLVPHMSAAMTVRGLHFAAFHGQPEVARLLLDRGFPADRPDEAGTTPLMTAVQGPSAEQKAPLVQLLLDRGADGFRRDGYGRDLMFLVSGKPPWPSDPAVAAVLVRWAAGQSGASAEAMLALLTERAWYLDELVLAASVS